MMNLVSKLFLMFWMFVSSGDMTPEYYFSSWEASGADGMAFVIDDYYLTFSVGEAAALHEVGHIRDAEKGQPSQSEGFQDAVNEFCETADMESTLGWQVCNVIDYSEAYAIFYMWDILYSIPQEFEEFYAR